MPPHDTNLGKAIATLVAEPPTEALCLEGLEQPGIGLIVIGPKGRFQTTHPMIDPFAGQQQMASKILGIVGMSHSGQAVARRAYSSYGMEILYHNPERVAEIELRCNAHFCPTADILREASFVCMALPLDAETGELIGTGDFALKRSQPILVAWDRSPPVERALGYLCGRYADRIHLSDLAAMAGLSECYFVRLFSTTLGMTPHRFQLLTRIVHARAMLRSGEEIGDVALQVGFADQSHLNRHFRSIVGVTPGQYRRALGKRNFAQKPRPTGCNLIF